MDILKDFTVLSRRNYHAIARYMLKPGERNLTTFPALMRDLRGSDGVSTYALTSLSAIPVADAIRSYHETLDLPEPTIFAVNANTQTARLRPPLRDDSIFMEAIRIEPFASRKDVILIDQFIGTGATLELGRAMLRCAGSRSIRSDSSVQWYDQALHSDVDTEHLTSTHEDFMREIGSKAASEVMRHRSPDAATDPQRSVSPSTR